MPELSTLGSVREGALSDGRPHRDPFAREVPARENAPETQVRNGGDDGDPLGQDQ